MSGTWREFVPKMPQWSRALLNVDYNRQLLLNVPIPAVFLCRAWARPLHFDIESATLQVLPGRLRYVLFALPHSSRQSHYCHKSITISTGLPRSLRTASGSTSGIHSRLQEALGTTPLSGNTSSAQCRLQDIQGQLVSSISPVRQYLISTKDGTELSRFEGFIKTLPDHGEGHQIIYSNVTWQSYLTCLTDEQAKDVARLPFVYFCNPNTESDDSAW